MLIPSSLSATLRAVLFGLLVAFGAMSQAVAQTLPARVQQAALQSATARGNLDHSLSRFSAGGTATVAFMGGSITEMNGYRPMVMKDLQTRFPKTEFKFINAGIASTCSHTGAFRLPTDVLAFKPDLLLVEFAVNDDQDAAHSFAEAQRGMEGVVRSAKQALPEMDIVMVHFVNQGMLGLVQKDQVPTSIAAHETVADHYGISTCNVAVELAKRIESGESSWKLYGGVHPKAPGNRIAADLVAKVMDKHGYPEVKTASSPEVHVASPEVDSKSLPAAIDVSSYSSGRFLPPDQVKIGTGWTRVQPDWSTIPGGFRDRFGKQALFVADKAGAELAFSFTGTAAGMYVLAGPDAGAVEVSVDGKPWQRVELYHRFSRGLHYPRTVVLESGLPRQKHQVKVRVAAESHPNSKGHAVRVLHFTAS